MAVFTKNVTLPYLNAMEKLNQEDLLELFPHMFNALKNHNMDTLKDYILEYKHCPVSEEGSA